jgi:hypothetical protein
MKTLFSLLLLAVSVPALADYRGDIFLGDTIIGSYGTGDNTTGADEERTVAGTPSCIEDGGTTEITAGVTDSGTAEFDSVVGMNLETVVATSANGFEAGKNYDCWVRASTLNAVTVSYPTISFSIENRVGSKGLIVARDLAGSTNTTALVQVDTAGTITATNQYVGNRLWNVTQGWESCITETTTGTPDTISIYPASPSETANDDVLRIKRDVCFPIDFPKTDAQGHVYVGYQGPNETPITDTHATNEEQIFNNADEALPPGVNIGDITTGIDVLPSAAEIWAYEIETGVSAKCSLQILNAVNAGSATFGATTSFRSLDSTIVRLTAGLTIASSGATTARGAATKSCTP